MASLSGHHKAIPKSHVLAFLGRQALIDLKLQGLGAGVGLGLWLGLGTALGKWRRLGH